MNLQNCKKINKSVSANAMLVKTANANFVIVKIANVRAVGAENKMPFRSKQQMKACFASKGFGGKVDCEEWARKTKGINKLPQKACYKESESEGFLIRTFSKDLDPEELKWHRDREDRIIMALEETDWMFQRDNQLPEKISGLIKIKANEWHRIIKGTDDLVVKIKKIIHT